MEGPRRSRATARRLTDAERPSIGWGAIVWHRAPAATEGSLARAAAQSPITWKPANTRLNGTMQAATRKHAVDMGHLGPKNVGGVKIRGAPKAGSVPRARLRHPRTGERDRDASDAVLIVLHATSRGRAGARHEGHRKRGSPVSRRAPPPRGPRAAPPGQARRVGRSPGPARHTRVRDPPYRYKPHMSSRRQRPADFLDHVDARTGAHRRRDTGPGHDFPSLIAY